MHRTDGKAYNDKKYSKSFVCGMLRHTERDCNVVYAHPDKEIEHAYI